jgi:signal peptidase I
VQSPPEYKGQVWGCRLLAAGTSDGKPFEILPIVDEQSRECLATLVERSISSQEVTDRLFDLFVLRGAPEAIWSDDGSGSLAKAIDDWLRQTGVHTRLVKGDSWKSNGGESFSGKLRDTLIDKTTFTTLPEAEAAIDGWRELYNEELSHDPTPAEESCQSPRLQYSTGDDSAAVQTPSLLGSPAHEADGVQSIPQRDPLVGPLELYQAPGLPNSLRRGAKSRQPIPSRDAPAGEAEGVQSIPQHGPPGGQLDLDQAPGLPDSLGQGTEMRQSVPPRSSPADEPEAVQSIPQHSSPSGQLEPHVTPAVPDSLAQGTKEYQSIPSRGSVSDEARAHRSAWKIPEWAVVTRQAAPSLGPSSHRHKVTTPARRARNAVVRVSEWVGIAVVSLLVIVAALTLIAPYFGWRVDTVVSGSMEPELKVGSIAVTRPVGAEEISVGDVITFRSPTSGKITSHRVLAIESGPSFLTEANANEAADSFVIPAREVGGRVCLHVPLAGYVLQRLVTPTGLLLLFLFGFAIVVAEIGSIFELRRKEPAQGRASG